MSHFKRFFLYFYDLTQVIHEGFFASYELYYVSTNHKNINRATNPLFLVLLYPHCPGRRQKRKDMIINFRFKSPNRFQGCQRKPNFQEYLDFSLSIRLSQILNFLLELKFRTVLKFIWIQLFGIDHFGTEMCSMWYILTKWQPLFSGE